MRHVVACLMVCAVVSTAAAQDASRPVRVDENAVFRDLESLAADGMEGRLAGTEGGARARAYLLDRLRSIGMTPPPGGFEQPFTFSGRGGERKGTNLLGVIRGSVQPDRYIVVSAHYDHLGVRNGEVFNGADDNASGTAALLALATYFKGAPPKNSLIIAFFDAEEAGLQGAKAFVANPPVPMSSIALNVNLDMVGRDASNTIYAVGTSYYPFLKVYLSGVAQPPVTLAFGHDVAGGRRNTKDEDWTNDSDHAEFHKLGIPFIYFGVEDFEQHHKATDDAATIGKAFLGGVTATVITAVRSFDQHLDEIVAATPRRPR